MSEKNKEPARGIFENKTESPPGQSSSSRKQDFKDPFVEHQESVNEINRRQKPKLDNIIGDQVLENTAASVNNAGPGKNVQADLDEMESFSEEDIDLAEQMVFRGYAEFDASMPRFPKRKFTICSTSAEEIAIVDEIVFNYVKSFESEDGAVDLPQNNVKALKNALFIAISYRGMDQEELMGEDALCHLNKIKQAIIKVTDLEDAGEVEKALKLRDSLKKKLLKRASRVRRMATPLIDFLSDKKFEFDSKMLAIMSTPGMLPKS